MAYSTNISSAILIFPSYIMSTYVEREFSDQIRRGSLTVEEVQEIMNSRIEVSEERKEIMEQLSVTDDDLF